MAVLIPRGLAAGSVTTLQGTVQRSVRSSWFGDNVIPQDPTSMFLDFVTGFALQNVNDALSLSFTSGGVNYNPFRNSQGIPIIRPLEPNSIGLTRGINNLQQFGNLPVNQVLFTITGTNIMPSVGAEILGLLSEPSEYLLDLKDENGNEIQNLFAECNR